MTSYHPIKRAETPSELVNDSLIVNGRALDLGRIVAMLCYEGMTTKEIAKECGTTRPSIERLLHTPRAQHLIDKEQEKRSRVIASIPIANFATRLKRLEQQYNKANIDGDRKDCFVALAQAREETKILRIGEEAEAELKRTPQITVNIAKLEMKQELHKEFDANGDIVNAVPVRVLEDASDR